MMRNQDRPCQTHTFPERKVVFFVALDAPPLARSSFVPPFQSQPAKMNWAAKDMNEIALNQIWSEHVRFLARPCSAVSPTSLCPTYRVLLLLPAAV